MITVSPVARRRPEGSCVGRATPSLIRFERAVTNGDPVHGRYGYRFIASGPTFAGRAACTRCHLFLAAPLKDFALLVGLGIDSSSPMFHLTAAPGFRLLGVGDARRIVARAVSDSRVVSLLETLADPAMAPES